MLFPRVAALALVPTLAGRADAQTLDDVRAELSENLQSAHFAKGLVTLVTVSDEVELSGATYDVDDEQGTKVRTLGLPFHRSFHPWGEEATGLYLEGALGTASAKQSVSDLYEGMAPGLETTVGSTWSTYGALLGVGPEFRVAPGLSVAAVLDVGLGHVQNRSDLSGPGAAFTSALLDGIALNWDATTALLGSGLRLDWCRQLGEEHTLEVVARYDLRFTRTLEHDDPAQNLDARAQFLTLRGDLRGPTGWVWNASPVIWNTTLGLRHMVEGDLFGVQGYAQVGGTLEWKPVPDLPGDLSLSGAWIVGDHVTGWTVGVGLSF